MNERAARAFERADDYDRHAGVQAAVAAWVAERIAATGPHRRVLELGCGTGLLAAAAAGPAGAEDWLATDIAPAMMARCRARLGVAVPFRYALADGEHVRLPGEGPFDLVCSSLVAQWFDDLPGAIRRQRALLRPGGRVVMATLADGTFGEWRAAVAAVGGEAGTPRFPTVEQLREMGGAITARPFESSPGSAFDLLRSVKSLGAGTPAAGYRPLAPGRLREAARCFEAAGGVLGYEVALIDLPAEAGA